HIAGIPVIEIKRTPLDGWGKVLKRCFDMAVSGFLFVLTLPVSILIALIVFLTSDGPVIYRNRRCGAGGEFDVFKFRTMQWKYCTDQHNPRHKEALAFEQKLIREHSARVGPLYKIKDDPRVTPFGRLLRATSLDELPQLINVLLGTMSLVGPRPHQPREVSQYDEHAKKILSIKPGVTGLAQVSGRSDLSFDEEVTLDLYYIENWSLKLDLAVLTKTPLAIMRQRVAE
ncbi:MAG: sugar transferase, partial [bacterium]|nr:sugar transferase [bacterium]